MSLRKLIRKAYFLIFDSFIFDAINVLYFHRLWARYHQELTATCPLREDLSGERVLILAPHCDDEIIGCGGAILSYLKQGKSVSIAYMTNGQKQGSSKDAAKVIAERQAEAYQVATTLGIPRKQIHFLGGTDGDLLNSPVEDNLAQVLQDVEPDAIFLPIPLDNHIDHFAVSQKLVKAEAMRESRSPSIPATKTDLYLYESQSPLTLFYSNVSLRITETFPQKMALLNSFTSQPYPFKFVANLDRMNGSFWGRGEICETYLITNVQRLREFMDTYFQEDPEGYSRRSRQKPNKHSASLISSYQSSRQEKAILRELWCDEDRA